MANTEFKNEVIKRKFLEYLKDSEGFSTGTIVAFEKAIYLWEDYTNKADFVDFNKTQAEEFKNWLKGKKKVGSEDSISLSYVHDNLRHLKTFFEWLGMQAGYKTSVKQNDIGYLNLSKSEKRIAIEPKSKVYPSVDEVRRVIEGITGTTEQDMRDKALLSLFFLTGGRISAILSLPMQSFDRNELTITQDPKYGVRTKYSKKIVTALVPFTYKEPLTYFIEWYDYLTNIKHFGSKDPIFPATKVESGKVNLGYTNTGEIKPVFWKTGGSARKILGERFEQADVPYYHPHTFRHLLVKEISKLPLTEEQKKAISQNLGHEDVSTTFDAYGYSKISTEKQIEIIRNIDFEGKNQKVVYQIGEEQLKKMIEGYKK